MENLCFLKWVWEGSKALTQNIKIQRMIKSSEIEKRIGRNMKLLLWKEWRGGGTSGIGLYSEADCCARLLLVFVLCINMQIADVMNFHLPAVWRTQCINTSVFAKCAIIRSTLLIVSNIDYFIVKSAWDFEKHPWIVLSVIRLCHHQPVMGS